MTEPKCKYFRKCAGCSLQHINYEEQIKKKKKILSEKIEFEEITCFSKKEYNYRNRLDMHFIKNGVGLRKKGGILKIERCEIVEERINTIISELNSFFSDNDTKTFQNAIIRTAEESSISFILNEDSTKLGPAIDKIKEFKTSADNITVIYAKDEEITSDEFFSVKGTDIIKKEYAKNSFWFNIQGFFQNNFEVAQDMINQVREIIQKQDTKEMSLIDLYGGVGVFGISNSDLFNDITIVENFQKSIDIAQKNIEENKSKNTKAVAANAKKFKRMHFPRKLFVITDPPRSGMDPETILGLKELRPKTIIYISCNIEQLGKDLKKFEEYEIESAALFDLFPQTPHVEAIVELRIKPYKP